MLFAEDFPYDWLMLWLSRQPEWQRSREFETTTRSTTPGFTGSRTADNSFGDDEDDGDDEEVPGKVKTRVVFQPTFDTTHTIYYKGHWLRVKRGRKPDGSNCEVLSIRYDSSARGLYGTRLWGSCEMIFQCRCTQQFYPQTTRSAGEEGVRGRSCSSDTNLFRRFSWRLALDRFPPQAPDIFHRS